MRSGILIQTADALHATMEHRSGLSEGLDVALHLRKPADPLELAEVLRKDMEPLHLAWSAVWVLGSDEAIAAANDLVGLCGDVMGKATVRGSAYVGLARWLMGEKWTPEQLAEWKGSIEQLARSRALLARILRKELGVGKAEFLETFGESPAEGRAQATRTRPRI